MRPLAAILLLAALGVSSPRVRGHGGEYIFSRLSLASDGRATLDLTADYGSNPMISSLEDATAALQAVLRLRRGESSLALQELAPVQFRESSQFDPTTPLPPSPPGEIHRLLTARYSWKAWSDALVFEVPQGNPHNVIFWVADAAQKEPAARSLFLIAGDHTPAIAVPKSAFRWAGLVAALSTLALGLGAPRLWQSLRRKPSATGEPKSALPLSRNL